MLRRYPPRKVGSFLLINLAGSYLYAMGLHIFTQPYRIAPGGMVGLATIANYLWGLPIGSTAFVLNIPLLILAWRGISHAFALLTALSTLLFTLCTDLFVVWMPVYPSASPLAPLLAALFGGILMGVGNALVYMSHSTTGGTAIVGALLQKRWPQRSMGTLITLVNLVVVIASIFAFRNIDAAIFAGICIAVSGVVMDKIVYGLNTNRLLFIISDAGEAIQREILRTLRRGVTALEGEGAYMHRKKKVLLCVVSKAQFYKIRALVQRVDPRAFIVGCEAGSVLGQGFRHID
nr:YitT family protein [Maliibacterium massiliense]